jgi:hypothetical protein
MFITRDQTYVNDGLWKTASATETLIKGEGILDLSLTSTFAVDIKEARKIANSLGFNVDRTQRISLLAYEAVLPGSSFELGQVFGDRQGITEQYPTKRVYPPIDVSFYIKYDYDVLRFFDGWLNLISPRIGGKIDPQSYHKFNYPDLYKCNINIVKFERQFRPPSQRLSARGTDGGINDPTTYTYTLINAYPSNVISVPLSYSQSDILRTTITFNYDRFEVQENQGVLYSDSNPITTPEPPQLPPLTPQERDAGIVQ